MAETQQETPRVKAPPIAYGSVEEKLAAFTAEDSSTSKTVTARMDEDHDSVIFEISKRDLIAAIGPSSSGLSRGCMVQMGGTFKFTAGAQVYDIALSLGRGGAGSWATVKMAKAVPPAPKAPVASAAGSK